jgi:hypothetical protein
VNGQTVLAEGRVTYLDAMTSGAAYVVVTAEDCE